MTGRAFPLSLLLAASLMLPASGCTQGHDGMGSDARTFDNPAHAQFAQAVRAGDETLARELLAAGANPNATDAAGTPLLHWAIAQDDRRAARLLLALGADPARGDAKGRTAVHVAAMARGTDWLDLLLDAGTGADQPNTLNGQTPLFDALRARQPDNIDRLLEAGARLDVRDRSGTTPLHQAALVNDLPSVRRFLEAGADPRAADDTGATFDAYLFDGDPGMLSGPAKRNFDWIRAWLAERGIAPAAR